MFRVRAMDICYSNNYYSKITCPINKAVKPHATIALSLTAQKCFCGIIDFSCKLFRKYSKPFFTSSDYYF